MSDKRKTTRREFLARSAKAGLSAAAAGAAAYLLYDDRLPSAGGEKAAALPDFSVPPKEGQVISIVKGPDRSQTVKTAIDSLGGIERFVKKGETVVIKPNIAFATPAMIGATTNPELVAEVVRLCYEKAGAKRVFIVDNPINDPASCFEITGIAKAAQQAGAEIVMPSAGLFENLTLPGGKLIKDWPVLSVPLRKADRLIGISPVKSHAASTASMSMKNWYGLLSGRRSVFHQDIHTIIAELAVLIRPTLVILDGTEVMMTNGPTGGSLSDLKRMDTMIAGTDMIAVDTAGCGLLGLKPADLPYIAMAEKGIKT